MDKVIKTIPVENGELTFEITDRELIKKLLHGRGVITL